MARTHKLFAGLAAVALLGCGNLADEQSSPPPIATITGTLSLAEGLEVPEEQLRMALIWYTPEAVNISGDPSWDSNSDCGPSENFLDYVTQNIALDATFPSQFTLNITEPPPMEAMHVAEEGGERIFGTANIFVYADGNGNGELDVRPLDGSSPDTVLATSLPGKWQSAMGDQTIQYEVHYFTEPYSYDELHTFDAGFTLQRYSLERSELLPIDTPIELQVTAAPYLQDHLCETQCRDYRPRQEGCPLSLDQLPAHPADAQQFITGNSSLPGWGWGDANGHTTEYSFCSAGTLQWTRETCTDCRCHTESCTFTEGSAGTAEWPCD